MTAPLEASTREAWRKYVSVGSLAPERVREPVFRAWVRCHDHGTSPLQPQAEALSPDGTEALLAQRAALISAARPFMAALSRAAGNERHAAMLGDEGAVVLDIVGDEQTVHGPEPFPGPGALLAEEVSGANGIGTPLAASEYVELVGPEHFIGGFHVFTCQGVPFRAPEGNVAGVISTSVRRVEASARLREILICAARGIEAELVRARLEEDVRRVLATGAGTALARLRDDVLQSYATARVRLDAAARTAPTQGIDATLRVIAGAQRAIDLFARQAGLWRELASSEVGVSQRVALDALVRDLVELLGTEARTRRVELQKGALEPATAHADPRALARDVFTALIEAFDSAESGGTVHLSTGGDASGSTLEVRGEPGGAGIPFDRTWRFPRAA
jgi:transcriptional regulator of acetoin/glycerol metabolism